MSARFARLITLGILPLLGACASTVVPPPTTGQPSTRPVTRTPPPSTSRPAPRPATRPAISSGFQAPRVMQISGLENVIGADSSALQRKFGTARLDVREGDVQKLQFIGDACVLDVYLYPLNPGAQPTATYVDARRASDGLDVDRASCVAALQR